ncbi:hypothetical protein [uncultured Marivirga sp.]|uniref:hypothetical protein n=2 Tax=Marivirga TaxID=869806 RepID=UPI0030EC6A36|tara:strand:+ start:8005 stop:8445 length:441 start_codon:yes stop_codon:yes gene_type:complete
MKQLLITLIFLSAWSVSNAQRGPIKSCPSTTTTISGNGNSTVLQANYVGSHVTFRTNCVAGASSYVWTISGGGSMSTTSTVLTVEPSDLVWLPPGGCDEFNSNLIDGSYFTSITVSASNTSTSATLPVVIHGVQKCKNFNPWKGKL